MTGVRLGWLTIFVAAGLAQCARGGPGTPSAEAEAVLDVVVDSLPFVIARTWGFAGDEPHTALLSTRAPAGRVRDEPVDGASGAEPPADHPAPWLERQLTKEHVAGWCSPDPDDGAYCDFALATAVVIISQVRFEADGRATVEVSIGRRGFGAITGLTLDLVGDVWTLSALDVIVIS